MWEPVNDQALLANGLNYEDLRRDIQTQKDFRVKNVGTGLATNVTCNVDNTQDSGFGSGNLELSLDGGQTFGNPVSLGNLAAGEISQVVTQWLNIPLDQTIQPHSGRVIASCESYA